ncbi:MAG: general stress protein [Chloroflexi bacterium]|nr:general stress protein [Chloroflexota bacterium]
MDTTPGKTGDRRTVVGVFDGSETAESALAALKGAGFSPDQVSVVARDARESQDMVENTGMGAEGATSGAFLGGITGGVIGWLVGIGALAIPGIGPVVAAGALATTIAGAAIGAVAGGLIGALVDAGVPEEEARGYHEHVKGGRILLTVNARTDEQAHEAYRILQRNSGIDVRGYGFTPATTTEETTTRPVSTPSSTTTSTPPVVTIRAPSDTTSGAPSGTTTGTPSGATTTTPAGTATSTPPSTTSTAPAGTTSGRAAGGSTVAPHIEPGDENRV